MRGSTDRLATRILWGMALGLVLGVGLRLSGARWPVLATANEWLAYQVLDPAGQIFLRLLFFVVVPLVFASLTLGVLQLGRPGELGPLAARTFSIFALNMTIGVALGLLMMNLLQPGEKIEDTTRARMVSEFQGTAHELQVRAASQSVFTFASLVEMFMPRNLLRAIVDFQILPLILFALLIGAAATSLPEISRGSMAAFLEVIVELMIRIVQYALVLAPYAVGALIASVAVKFGLEFLKPLGLFVVGVLGVMIIHLFGTMSLLLKLFTRHSPLLFFRAIRTIMITAFSTSSSSATLPTTIQVSRQNLGISASTAGFVLPLGATMNMSGTALYEGCVVLFVAQVYGVPLSLAQQVTLLILAVLSAVAVAGIPGASLPLIVGLLASFGIPAEGIALILGIDRLLDMARTVVNVSADVVTACIVDSSDRDRLGAPAVRGA